MTVVFKYSCITKSIFRYIPENFYSDFTISDQNNPTAAATSQATTSISSNRLPDYLETVVAAAGKTNQQQSQTTQNLINAQNQPLSQSTVLQVRLFELFPYQDTLKVANVTFMMFNY